MRPTTLFACLILSLGSLEIANADVSRPNIVYILADDLGYGDLGCYGQEVLKTPNIDRLASEGIRFTQHYAGDTVCAPSRSAFLEGLHTGHSSVRANLPYHLLDPERQTVAEALQAGGYHTAVIGKWGLGHPPPLDDPQRHGFDYHYGYVNMWHAHNFYPEYLYRNGQKDYLEGNVLDPRITFDRQPDGSGVARKSEVFAPYELEREALSYLKQRSKEQAPFFLYFALNQPHNNGEYGRVYGDGGYEILSYGAYTNRDWPRAEKGFAANIRIIDDIVGNVLDALESQGLADNTIVIFSSDNGACQGAGHDHQFFKSSGSKRGYKRDLYEGGIRVPFIARWHDKIAPGSQSDHVSAMWDLFPTFCEIADASYPDNLDGISLLPSLLGESNQMQHDYLYWEFYSQGGKQAVRQGNWKLVKLNISDKNTPVVTELYDLQNDPSETTDLSREHPEVVARLTALLEEAHEPHPIVTLFPDEEK